MMLSSRIGYCHVSIYSGSCVPAYNEHTARRISGNDGVVAELQVLDE